MNITKLFAALAIGALPCAAHATLVGATFTGTVKYQSHFDSLLDTSFSGSFAYDTGAALIADEADDRIYALALGALQLTVGGVTYTNVASDYNEVVAIHYTTGATQLELIGYKIGGAGPLAGLRLLIKLNGSNDPDLKSEILPAVLPSDFTDVTVTADTPGGGAFIEGPVTVTPTATAIVTRAVPEPATWAMFVGGFGLIGGALRGRRRMLRLA